MSTPQSQEESDRHVHADVHTHTHKEMQTEHCFHALAFLETYPNPFNPDLHLDLDVALANEIYKTAFLILICQGFLVS